jgi:tetratricopeptide (TPR) repeat protein
MESCSVVEKRLHAAASWIISVQMDQQLPNEIRDRIEAASARVEAARASGDRNALTRNLKELANIQRRIPATRADANGTYAELIELSWTMGEPLEAAWAIRHIGLNHEYEEELEEAERCYDESLKIFREHAHENSLNYANTIRYPAVIKNRLGKRAESAKLWEEACERYEQVELPIGVAEAAANLAGLALDEGDTAAAATWIEKADLAAAAASDRDTDKMMHELKARYREDAAS